MSDEKGRMREEVGGEGRTRREGGGGISCKVQDHNLGEVVQRVVVKLSFRFFCF